ncbi:MAG TPA: type II secretion system F family protein [Alphaproteobacteria bacterium]|jgi:tight adherence protein C
MSALLAFLPPGITAIDVLTGLSGITAFMVVLAVWQGLRARAPIMARTKTLLARRSELLTQYLHQERRKPSDSAQTFMARVVRKLRLLQGRKTAEMKDQLAQAGLRSREALVALLFAKFALPIVFGVLSLLLIKGLGMFKLSPNGELLACLGSVLAGSFAPALWVKNRTTKRYQAIRKSMPDALDLLVICVEAGLSLDAALGRVAREFGPGAPELSDELRLTSIELGFLPERRQALENLAKRVALPAVRALVGSLQQTEKYGTPLAQSLRVLAAEFRMERMMRAEEKAARLPATLTVPMVVFILPTLFIVLIGPAILNVIDALRKM